ncbi:hypothetical protein M409DRAFT_25829 [Zasmidium cellare ATCC 36951]|uniref:Uncharacterized protein n=1 Tax=Zasmidium cellare ATCC 36951 TaxID=1080233 RepID=A0A6A6C9C2_ZASCE|nr:uncharacterized protein M409DRAFT_25829 [Zasmidium cellare ATCC 36951]KAF2163641.1 hypothetical protein M409DRAFT_25829 [Zasmidium cellare ATCC 36951]
MTNLKHANLLPALGVVYDDMNAAFGCRQVARMAGFVMLSDNVWKLCVRYGSIERTTGLLLEAIADSKLQVRDMRLSDSYCSRALILVMGDPSKAPSLCQSFGSLAYLELNCMYALLPQKKSLDPFLRVLEVSKTLQHLSLFHITGQVKIRDLFAKIATICSRHELKSVKLVNGSVTAGEIRMLLDPHKPTLESLKLDDLDAFNDQSDSYTFRSLYSTLAEDFTLREFTLKDLWEMRTGALEYDVQFEGVEEVRKGLENLTKRTGLFKQD